jgi:hypothetical protein
MPDRNPTIHCPHFFLSIKRKKWQTVEWLKPKFLRVDLRAQVSKMVMCFRRLHFMWFYSEVPEKYIDHILGMETCSLFSTRNVFVFRLIRRLNR